MVTHLNQDHSKPRSSHGNGVLIGLIHPHEILQLGLAKVLHELLPQAHIMRFTTPRDVLEMRDTKFALLMTELNLKLPECSLSSLETLRNGFPGVRILAMSPLSERHLGLPAMKVGANVFLPMGSDLDELRLALESLLAGRDYMTSEMAAFMADEAQGRNPRTGFARLSPRELDVIRQLMWGMKLSVVASRMGLNIRTASCYKRNALAKLNMGSVAELVRYSSEQGIAV
jgi:two-component system, NarL family, invasion response regulator UvrY